MRKQVRTIYLDVGFEILMHMLYGACEHGMAGHTNITSWKKHLSRLFRTLKTAIAKNVNGDDKYKEHLMDRCDVALDGIRVAKSIDEVSLGALQFTFELLFSLIGQMPDNWEKSRARHDLVTDLADHRTFSYVCTDRQKVRQITDAAYCNRLGKDDPKFEVLIDKFMRDFHRDPRKFLAWLRTEHRSVYDRFI